MAAKRPDARLFMLAYEKFQYAYNLEGLRTFVKVLFGQGSFFSVNIIWLNSSDWENGEGHEHGNTEQSLSLHCL